MDEVIPAFHSFPLPVCLLQFYYFQNRNVIVWHSQRTIRGFEKKHVLFATFWYVFPLHCSIFLFNCCLMICVMAWHAKPVISWGKQANLGFAASFFPLSALSLHLFLFALMCLVPFHLSGMYRSVLYLMCLFSKPSFNEFYSNQCT